MNGILFIYEYLGDNSKKIISVNGKHRFVQKDCSISDFHDRKFLVHTENDCLCILYIDKYIHFMRQFFIDINFYKS